MLITQNEHIAVFCSECMNYDQMDEWNIQSMQSLQSNVLQFPGSVKQVRHKQPLCTYWISYQSTLVPYLSMDFRSSYPLKLCILNQTLVCHTNLGMGMQTHSHHTHKAWAGGIFL